MALVEVPETKTNYYLDSAQFYSEPGVLTVLAIPINEDECMFIPYPHELGKILGSEADEEMKTDVEDPFNTEMPVDDDDFAFGDTETKWQKKKGLKAWLEKRKVQRWDRESKTDKFLKRIPDNVEHIRVLYASSIGEHSIKGQLTHQINKTQSRRSAQIMGLTAALPFALILDLITFTFIFTISDLALIVNNSRKMKRGKIVEELMASGHISFAANDALDEFYSQVMGSTYKLPDNYMIENLCEKLKCEQLIKTIRKVRNSKGHKQKIPLVAFEVHDSFAHEAPKHRQSYSTLSDIPPEYES